jgi:type II secretory pathway pseudopilin PulG
VRQTGPGAAARFHENAAGFTLVAIIVALAVMSILLGVVVQSVSFQQQREKEEELIFRGKQTVEAIRLFRARNGRFPVSLEELTTAKPRVLRKVWTDPITRKLDWVPVFLGTEGTSPVVPRGSPGFAGGGDQGIEAPLLPTPTPGPDSPSTTARGPIIGVHSRSCANSIKVLDGHIRYCEWKFVFDPQRQGAGGGAPVPTPAKGVVPTPAR